MEKIMNFIKTNTWFRNIIAVIIGLFIGGYCNMAILIIGSKILPLPEGVDINKIETIVANIDKYTIPHFINVFLAHAIQPLLGAFIAVKIGLSHHFRLAMIIGCLSLLGGIMAVSMIPAPMTYNIIDLVFAYIPMAWIGYKLAYKAQ